MLTKLCQRMDLTFITLFFAPEVAVYIRTATFLLVLIIFILWGDRTSWITTEMIINVFRGLSLVIVPSFVLKILVSACFFKINNLAMLQQYFLQIVLHSFYVYVIPINFTASKIFILAVPSVVVTKPCLY